MTLLAISADSHITEPGDCYIDRIDPKFRDRAPIAVTDETMGATMLIDNGRSRLPYGMVAAAGRPADKIHPHLFVPWEELHPGGWDPEERLEGTGPRRCRRRGDLSVGRHDPVQPSRR